MFLFVRDCPRHQPKVISCDIHTIFIPRWRLSHKTTLREQLELGSTGLLGEKYGAITPGGLIRRVLPRTLFTPMNHLFIRLKEVPLRGGNCINQ